MPEKTHATQKLILAAAIEALEESGPSGATTRAIAERAGVNVAAINYYFRSKDNLLALAAETILDRLFEWDELEDTDDMDIRDRLVYGLNMLAEGFVNCPKPLEGLLSDIMLSDMNAQVLDRVRAFMRRAVDELCALDPERPRHAVETNVAQLFSAVLLPGLIMPGIFDDAAPIDLSDARERMQYIRGAVEKLL